MRIDLIAGLTSFTYGLAAYILGQLGVIDLSEFVAQPEAAAAFGIIALRRYYKERKKGKEK